MAILLCDQVRQAQLTAGTPAGDQRADERYPTVLQVAKFATDHGDELCILRNVSAGGLQAVVYCKLTVGERIRFELRTGRSMAGRIVWTSGSAIGVAFDRKVPIMTYLAHQAIEEMGRHTRPPRIRLSEQGVLYIAKQEFTVDILDASLTGMRIRISQILTSGEACRIAADGLAERGAEARWCRDGQAGLQFGQPLGFREFAAWRRHGSAHSGLH